MEPSVAGADGTRTIAQLYRDLTAYLDRQWGRASQIWVTGEVQKLSDHRRSGHCYVDLVDPAVAGRDVPTLKAKCWRSTWGPLKASLREAGLTLDDGAVVRVRGYVDLYAPHGELGFIITSLDLDALRLAALGEHARRREALLRALRDEGLLEANRSCVLPEVPLWVGLVASKGTEGYHDFLGMLEASGFSFRVSLVRATVQGARAPVDVAAGVRTLGTVGCDVICVVRGGGSQADLAAFDDERVARAIASCPVPVLTGIGHTGDVSVADLVAHEAFRTPTACAEAIAAVVRTWYADRVASVAQRATDAAAAVLDELDDGVDQSRRHLVVVGRHRLARADDALSASVASVARTAPHGLARAGASVATRARRLGPLAHHRLGTLGESVAQRRALLAAYDPARLLSRGWSITTAADGSIVRSVEGLAPGSTLLTRLADGVARSSVTGVTTALDGEAS
jgi:exodeoxyribonuclease VII large subunit